LVSSTLDSLQGDARPLPPQFSPFPFLAGLLSQELEFAAQQVFPLDFVPLLAFRQEPLTLFSTEGPPHFFFFRTSLTVPPKSQMSLPTPPLFCMPTFFFDYNINGQWNDFILPNFRDLATCALCFFAKRLGNPKCCDTPHQTAEPSCALMSTEHTYPSPRGTVGFPPRSSLSLFTSADSQNVMTIHLFSNPLDNALEGLPVVNIDPLPSFPYPDTSRLGGPISWVHSFLFVLT